jgi:hypothetical protein
MNLSLFQSLALLDQAPWLPDVALQHWGLHVCWGLVLGSLTFLLGTHYNFKWRGLAVAAVTAWSLWPGSASPSYWLGLAFQSPSLMSSALCVIWATQAQKSKLAPRAGSNANGTQTLLLVGAGILLGWVLLGDTLAWWSISIYGFGFSTWALVLACVLAFSLWCVGSRNRDAQPFTVGFSVVLLLYVLTRLPSGNLWDAVLDPWLWFALQIMAVRSFIRRRLDSHHVSKATRV